MKIKSVADCLNFTDTVILSDIGKNACIGNLEHVRDYVLSEYKNKYIEDMVALNKVLSQINIITDKFNFDKEDDLKNEYQYLRKCILAWLRVTKVENDNDKDEDYSYLLNDQWIIL